MFRTKRSRLTATIAAAAVFGTGAALAVAQMAQAHDDHGSPAGAPTASTGAATFLVASLNGRNEVPGPAGSPKVGDPDGQAVAVLRIQGNQLSFAFKWKNIGAPVAGHIHIGASGSNGGVQVPVFGAGLPDIAVADTGVNYSFPLAGMGAPAGGHGLAVTGGATGMGAVQLFSARHGLPASVSATAGVVKGAKGDLVRQISPNPTDFYTNLHTA